MEDLIECKQIVFPCESAWKKSVCDVFSRSDETGELKKTIDRHIDDRRIAKPIQTILLPLSDVGGKSGFKEALAVLRKMDGVTGANLFSGELQFAFNTTRTAQTRTLFLRC